MTHRAIAAALKTGLLAGFILLTAGCLRSRVVITSEPADAQVFFRERPRGVTPITIPFNWYWYYEVRVEKEGYESIETIERFRTPPWLMTPLDLVAELIPLPITDTRELHYVLKPVEGAGTGEIEALPIPLGARSPAPPARIPGGRDPSR